MANNLKAGEFFGDVPNKRRIPTATLSEVVHLKQISVPRHSHELAHFQFLLEGVYSETCVGQNVVSHPLTVTWHRPGITHKDEIGPAGGRFFMIEIESFAIEKFREFMPLPEDFYVKNHALVSLAHSLYREFKNWQTGSDLIAEGITLEMLGFSLRKRLSGETRFPKWLARVVEKLNEEFTGNISIERLALEANVHPVYLASVFRRFHRQTIGEYVQKLRVNYASKLLLDKEIPLAEIAYSAGFSDQSHFTRIFKRHAGITPGSYRSSLD